jgi:CubicO group peptidase (beta-lactamase class C family)
MQAPGAASRPFATVSKLMNDVVAAQRLPGAVVVIGHDGKVVFHETYGWRKLAGEPGLDGLPAPAEPMTEDTVFDMASLTKCLATATAVMQLYEQGKVQFGDLVQKYLSDFNAANDPRRAKVTVRMLLTHTSGEPGDVNLGDPWGLNGADKTEGIHRALTTPLESEPGAGFRYSDINFILLGALIENITGEAEDVSVQQNVYGPRGGMIFPIGSFAHTGFTGTALWMNAGSDTYVVLLANSVHLRGSPPISNLRGEVATAAALALGLYSAAS